MDLSYEGLRKESIQKFVDGMRSAVIVTDNVRRVRDEIAHRRDVRREIHTEILWGGNQNARDHVEDLDVDGMIILK